MPQVELQALQERINGEYGVFNAHDLVARGRTRQEHQALVKELLGEVRARREQAESEGKSDTPEFFRLKRWEAKLQEEKGHLEYDHNSWFDSLQAKDERGQPVTAAIPTPPTTPQKLDLLGLRPPAGSAEARFTDWLDKNLEDETPLPADKLPGLDEFLARQETADVPAGEQPASQEAARRLAKTLFVDVTTVDDRDALIEQEKELQAQIRDLSAQMRAAETRLSAEPSVENREQLLGLSKKRRDALVRFDAIRRQTRSENVGSLLIA